MLERNLQSETFVRWVLLGDSVAVALMWPCVWFTWVTALKAAWCLPVFLTCCQEAILPHLSPDCIITEKWPYLLSRCGRKSIEEESQTIKPLNGKLPHSETVDAVPTSETTEQSDGERRLECQGLTLASNDPRSQISRHIILWFG